MKKQTLRSIYAISTLSIVILISAMMACKSTPKVYIPPPVNITTYQKIYIEFEYDPVFLMTVQDRKEIIKDLTSRINAMGFTITTTLERADMLLEITIDELLLTDRNERLTARASFGLAKNESLMIYTASFIDSKTYEEITSTGNTMKNRKFFPSKEEVKKIFFSQMKDEILEFMSKNKIF